MDKRMVEFIRALRAAGVRISLAETQDALSGVDQVGVYDPQYFRLAMRSTLVKEHPDQAIFDYFFPLFFSSNQPPLQDILENLTPQEQQMLREAIESVMGSMEALRDLLQRLLEGRRFTDEELEELARMSGLPEGDQMYQRQWFERRMNRQAGLAQLEKWLDELMDMLEQMGMDAETRAELEAMLRENLAGLSEQISNYVGASLADRMAEKEPDPKPDLLDVPITRLSQNEIDSVRDEIRRLVARLRTRASLRQKKSRQGSFDPRRTMRSNMRYGGVPIEMKFRKQHKKPSLVVICDVSTSMRAYVEFLLTMVYELQDQVQRTHSFIFISDLVDISMDFEERQPQAAVQKILRDNPPGYYSTDLGNSLKTFAEDHMHKIDHRTTVIILGDGRNNYNDPRLDITAEMRKRARRLIWFCPEPQFQWGTGDSDMHRYANHADGVYLVTTLRSLAAAVDSILADG